MSQSSMLTITLRGLSSVLRQSIFIILVRDNKCIPLDLWECLWALRIHSESSLNLFFVYPKLKNQVYVTILAIAGLVSLFSGISTFVGYLVPKSFFYKNSSGTIQSLAGEKDKVFISFSKVNIVA